MVRGIKWSLSARTSKRLILEYWAKRNGTKTYSKKLANLINTKVEHLKSFPLTGKATNIDHVRLLICSHYLIYYTINNNQILIVALFDSRQDPEMIIESIKNSLNG